MAEPCSPSLYFVCTQATVLPGRSKKPWFRPWLYRRSGPSPILLTFLILMSYMYMSGMGLPWNMPPWMSISLALTGIISGKYRGVRIEDSISYQPSSEPICSSSILFMGLSSGSSPQKTATIFTAKTIAVCRYLAFYIEGPILRELSLKSNICTTLVFWYLSSPPVRQASRFESCLTITGAKRSYR